MSLERRNIHEGQYILCNIGILFLVVNKFLEGILHLLSEVYECSLFNTT